jgi:hypothetical protein
METAVEPVATPIPVAPVPAPMSTPPSVNTNPAPATTPASSGSFQDSFKKAVSNPVQIGFGILGALALYYAIYYYRYNNQMQKIFVKNIENKMDELDMKYSDLISKVNKANASGKEQDILPFF